MVALSEAIGIAASPDRPQVEIRVHFPVDVLLLSRYHSLVTPKLIHRGE
jgi:hypothetical protein